MLCCLFAQEMINMPDTNLVRSVTYLLDSFLSDFHAEGSLTGISESDLRAQIEVNFKHFRN